MFEYALDTHACFFRSPRPGRRHPPCTRGNLLRESRPSRTEQKPVRGKPYRNTRYRTMIRTTRPRPPPMYICVSVASPVVCRAQGRAMYLSTPTLRRLCAGAHSVNRLSLDRTFRYHAPHLSNRPPPALRDRSLRTHDYKRTTTVELPGALGQTSVVVEVPERQLPWETLAFFRSCLLTLAMVLSRPRAA
jgi:hypothetical protein